MHLALVLLLILQLPSLQAIYRFLPHPFVIGSIVLLGSVLIYYLLLVKRLNFEWLDSSLLTFLLLAVPFLVSLIAHFVLQAPGFGPTDADIDDAMIVPIQSLVRGFGLYGKLLYTNNPISPGPGWLILNAPFAYFAYPVFSLFVPFYLLVLGFTLVKLGRNNQFINLLLILLFSSVYFWKLLIAGYDLIPLACLFLALFLVIEQCDLRGLPFLFLVLLVGVVATSRLVFVAFPLLLSLFFWKKNKMQAIGLGFGSLAVALVFHFLFYQSPYPPMHLLEKASASLSPLALVTAIALAIGITIGILRTSFGQKTRRLWLYTGGLALPLFAISFSDLLNVRFSWADWEAAAYPICIAPVAIYASLQSTFDRK